MLRGAAAINCVPKLTTTYKSRPMPNSHVPSRTHARNESGGIFSPRRRHGLISSGGVQLATAVFDGNDRIAAAISPWRRCAVADADGDHGKRRHIIRPWRVTVAHHHQQVNRVVRPFDERAQ